ncbi:MAG: hypothetical protein V4481_05245 [Patescibacteria group bacterium]
MVKISKWFDRFWNWVVYSSANPLQVSSTIKWGAGILGTLLTVVLGFGHITFPTQELTALIDPTIQVVQLATLCLATLGTVISGLRKIYLTIRGRNIQTAPPTAI